MKTLWLVAFPVLMASASFAAADDDESKKALSPEEHQRRLEKLERELESLKADLPGRMSLDQEKKEPVKSTEVEFKATFTDGFHIKTTDGNLDLHIGGRWLEEYRYSFNRPVQGGALRTSTNSFYIREAFISLDGTLFTDWGFKLNGDFSPAAGALIEEAWVEWKALKVARLFFGQFKAPNSMETTDSPRFLEAIQRSPMARFVPGMDLGVRVEGGFGDGLLSYQLAVTNGRSHVVNAGRNQIDDNDGKEYLARLQVAPFTGMKDTPLHGLRFGVYGSFSHIGQDAGINPTGWPGNIATNELAVTYLIFPAPAVPTFRFAGDRFRVGGELTYFHGPFMVRGELMERTDEFQILATNSHGLLRTVGYYGTATVVLTGEDKLPNARLVPLRPLNINEGTWGAVELIARYAGVSLSRPELQDLLVDFTQNSNRVRSFTLGVNWWPMQNTRFSVDYVSEHYFQGIQMSGAHHRSHLNGVLARFQVDF
jgi:phosphate-selective porin OprO and OprP